MIYVCVPFRGIADACQHFVTQRARVTFTHIALTPTPSYLLLVTPPYDLTLHEDLLYDA